MKKTGIESLDSRGRINLAKYTTPDDRVFIVEKHPDGKIVLTPAEVIPKNDSIPVHHHGGFQWGQSVRIARNKGTTQTAGLTGRIEGFHLDNPLVANVVIDQTQRLVYSYNVSDLEAL